GAAGRAVARAGPEGGGPDHGGAAGPPRPDRADRAAGRAERTQRAVGRRPRRGAQPRPGGGRRGRRHAVRRRHPATRLPGVLSMGHFIDLSLSGVTNGFAIAAIGLSLVLIWRAPRIVNFARGGMALVCAYLAYTVTQPSGSYWLGFAAAIGAGLVLGAVLERVLIRLVEDKPQLNAVIV